MGLIADFLTATMFINSPRCPIICLHGSSSDELSLVDFAAQAAPQHPCYFPRGRETTDQGFTFFRRASDRSIDRANLKFRADQLVKLVAMIGASHRALPILIGYSSGAVAAAALLANIPKLTAGAVLLRPECPYGTQAYPSLAGHPLLVLSGKSDERRQAKDASSLVELLESAGAEAEWHELDCGHGFDPSGKDIELTRAWLSRRG